MKLELAEKIVDACQNSEIEASLRENYSGRGMFGKTMGLRLVLKQINFLKNIPFCS